jgi:hypothetical protein
MKNLKPIFETKSLYNPRLVMLCNKGIRGRLIKDSFAQITTNFATLYLFVKDHYNYQSSNNEKLKNYFE